MGISVNYGYLFGGPHKKDYSIWGSILGSPVLGNYQIIQEELTLHKGLEAFCIRGFVHCKKELLGFGFAVLCRVPFAEPGSGYGIWYENRRVRGFWDHRLQLSKMPKLEPPQQQAQTCRMAGSLRSCLGSLSKTNRSCLPVLGVTSIYTQVFLFTTSMLQLTIPTAHGSDPACPLKAMQYCGLQVFGIRVALAKAKND